MVLSEDDGFELADDSDDEEHEEPARKGPAKPRRFREQITVKLSKGDWENACQELADALVHRDELALAASTVASNYKAQIKLEDDRIDELKGQVSSRRAKLEVELQERFVHQTGTCEIIRVDTGEKIRERAMTAAERAQPDLPGVEA